MSNRVARNREHKFKRQQCREKRALPDFYVALRTAERMRLEGGNINPLSVYECSECGCIHVGHLAKGESMLMYGGYAENVRKLQGIQA